MGWAVAVGWLPRVPRPEAGMPRHSRQPNLETTHVPAILDKILRIGEGKILRQLESITRAVNAIEDEFVAMSDEELQGQTALFKERIEAGEALDDLMPEAFATVREAAKR